MRVALLSVLAACSADPKVGPADTAVDTEALEWTPPDVPGPYGVGVRTLTWTDARGKELTADVWYPAHVEEGDAPSDYPPFTLAIGAHRGAPIDVRGRPHPLAAFSHGFAGIRFQSAFLMEHLASRGWVVVAPDHNLNTFLDINAGVTAQVTIERPGDIREAVDHLLAWSDARTDGWVGAVDGSRYAMIGHSFGALTTLMVAGGSVDLYGVIERCVAGEGDGQACRYIDDIEPDAVVGLQEADPRAEVAVPLSPGVWYGFGPDGEGLGTMAPSLVLGGTKDRVLDYEDEIVGTYTRLASPKTFGRYEGGGHYVFTDICLIAPFFSPECEDPEGWIDLDAAQATTKALVAAWLDVNFLDEPRSAPWTTVEGLGSPEFLSIEGEE
jgi:predicted dienelactone hydrolase